MLTPINQSMGSTVEAPEVGMGCTFLMWSDRNPGTIVEVVNAKTIVVQRDNAKRLDNGGPYPYTESQDYDFSPNVEAEKETFTKRKNGRWVRKGSNMKNGQKIAIGYRSAYRDPSF